MCTTTISSLLELFLAAMLLKVTHCRCWCPALQAHRSFVCSLPTRRDGARLRAFASSRYLFSKSPHDDAFVPQRNKTGSVSVPSQSQLTDANPVRIPQSGGAKVAAKKDLLSESAVASKEQRKADWAIMREMAKYLWPKVKIPCSQCQNLWRY